jgi:hypothetical protein
MPERHSPVGHECIERLQRTAAQRLIVLVLTGVMEDVELHAVLQQCAERTPVEQEFLIPCEALALFVPLSFLAGHLSFVDADHHVRIGRIAVRSVVETLAGAERDA